MSLWHIAWSYLWNRKLTTIMTVISVALGVLTTWAGLLTAYRADLPANPTIIGLSCVLLMSVSLVRALAAKLIADRNTHLLVSIR